MSIYASFARHYQQGAYLRFSERVAQEYFPAICTRFQITPTSLLDLACGTGYFALSQAQQGMRVCGLDQSPQLLDLAREEALKAKLNVRWIQGDMAKFSFPEEFDCVSCFFDSLNYLIRYNDLADCFKNVNLALRPGGYFVFDMNTIYGLAVLWQKQTYLIARETPDYLEVHENSYDYENNLASMRVLMMERQGELWRHSEETHLERGYPLDELLFILDTSGFSVLGLSGDPLTFAPLMSDDGRLWCVAQKKARGGVLATPQS